MRRFTLVFLLVFAATIGFAQRSINTLPQLKSMPGQRKAMSLQGFDRKARNGMNKAPRKAPELVTPPNEGETWTLSDAAFTVYYDDEHGWVDYTAYISATMNVCIDGTDIYIQGLSPAFFPDAWVKGTISGGKATIPTGQFLGEDEYGAEYIIGQMAGAETGNEPPVDIVFDYDEAAGTLTFNPKYAEGILLGEDPEQLYCYAYWEALTLTKGEIEVEPEADIVTPPAAEAEDWTAIGVGVTLNEGEDGSATPEFAETTDEIPMKVIFDGDDVYFQGFFPPFPIFEDLLDAWLKGTRSGNKITIPSGQYFGYALYNGRPYHFYFNGLGTEGIGDIVLTLNEDGTLMDNTGSSLAITSPAANSVSGYYDIYLYLKIQKDGVEDGIKSVGTAERSSTFYNLQGVQVSRPVQKGVYIVNGRKVVVK